MIIRLALYDDIPEIMGLITGVVPLMHASGNFQWDSVYPNIAVFENDILLSQLWVAEIDRTIAGIAAITTDQEAEYAQVGWDISEEAIVIHRLAVSIHHQGKGVAASLLHQAEIVARERAIKKLRVDTNTQNLATQKLFPKLGYVFAGEIGLYGLPINFTRDNIIFPAQTVNHSDQLKALQLSFSAYSGGDLQMAANQKNKYQKHETSRSTEQKISILKTALRYDDAPQNMAHAGSMSDVYNNQNETRRQNKVQELKLLSSKYNDGQISIEAYNVKLDELLDQLALAHAIGVDQGFISKVINKKQDVSYYLIRKLCFQLKYSPEWLILGTGEKKINKPESAKLITEIQMMRTELDILHARMRAYELELKELKTTDISNSQVAG
eukprot:gene11525-11621_t